MDLDTQVRTAAFQWLREQIDLRGDILDRELLQDGFTFKEQRIPLVSPQGIFKPRILNLPLTITTTPESPYSDRYTEGNFLLYSYRGTDPNHRDNVGLREVMRLQKPLIYLYGVAPSRYIAVWPVFVIDDQSEQLMFKVVFEDISALRIDSDQDYSIAEGSEGRRAYITTTTRARLHQRRFRERVLDAYRSQCAFCRLRHRELLDAAHIIPDHEPESLPTINNGISLCKIHHAAFDRFILGVTPDYLITVHPEILDESDGPILKYGIQDLDGIKLYLPRQRIDWPSKEALDWKYQRFLQTI